MKLSAIFLAIASFAITACSTNSTGLPFGEMRFVAPAQFERKPLPKFFPTPFVLKAEFVTRRLSGDAVIGFIGELAWERGCLRLRRLEGFQGHCGLLKASS